MATNKNTTAAATAAAAAFALNDSHKSVLTDIERVTSAGGTRFVSQDEAGDLVTNGYVSVNTEMKDDAGKLAARLTDKGRAALPAPVEGAAPAVKFKILTASPPAVEGPKRKDGGVGREPKFPLHALAVGQVIFIEAEKGADPSKLSKSFGTMVSTANRNAQKAFAERGENTSIEDKYFTARSIKDGKAAGFGDEFDGIGGTAIYRDKLENRKPRAPRKAKGGAETAPDTTAA